MIHEIDLETWPRRRQFDFFKDYDYPFFNIGTNIDISNVYNFTKKHAVSLFKTILYTSLKTINEIPEFRCRIRGDNVIEHSIVHPSFTVAIDNNQFSFCNADFDFDIHQFFQNAQKSIDEVKQNPFIQSDSKEDNRIYITCIPWISFTSVTHPINLKIRDSVPRLAWGKYIIDDNTVSLPLSLQVHHALADGYHAGLFFNQFRECINQPDILLKDVI